MFSLICARIKGWVNNREAGDLRRNHIRYDVTVMVSSAYIAWWQWCNLSHIFQYNKQNDIPGDNSWLLLPCMRSEVHFISAVTLSSRHHNGRLREICNTAWHTSEYSRFIRLLLWCSLINHDINMALWGQQRNINQTSSSQQTPHSSPVKVSIMRIIRKLTGL